MEEVTVITMHTRSIVGLNVMKVMYLVILFIVIIEPVWVTVVGVEAIQYAILGNVPVYHPIVQFKCLRHHVYHITS